VRIGELIDGFGANGSLSSICGDFAPSLTGVGAALSQAMGPRCLQAPVVDTSGAAPALRADHHPRRHASGWRGPRGALPVAEAENGGSQAPVRTA